MRSKSKLNSLIEKQLLELKKGDNLKTFLNVDSTDLNVLVTALMVLPKGVSKLIFGDGSDDFLPARLEAILGQQEARKFQLYSPEENTVRWIYLTKRAGVDHIDPFTSI